MQKRIYFILFTAMVLVHFSPQIIQAEEYNDNTVSKGTIEELANDTSTDNNGDTLEDSTVDNGTDENESMDNEERELNQADDIVEPEDIEDNDGLDNPEEFSNSEGIPNEEEETEVHTDKSTTDENQRKKEIQETSNLLKLGDRNNQVLEMKLNILKLGFGTHWKNPTNYFGSDTEDVVRDFQEYYGISVTGFGDEPTLSKITEVLSSPNQLGSRSEKIKEIKLNLVTLGFGTHWKNPTTYFGSDTEDVVREFQKAKGLAINGIVDEITLNRINELLDAPLKLGVRRADVVDFKKDLMSLGFGTHWTNPTNYFGPDTDKVVREFQNYYGLSVDGTGGKATLSKITEVLSSPNQLGSRSEKIKEIKLNLVTLGFGTHWKNPTTYFGSDTEDVVREFQKANGLAINGIVDEITLSTINELLDAPLKLGLRRADVVDFKKDLMLIGFGTHWTNPTNYFGPDTEKVVRKFQSYFNLTVNGVGNESTLKKIKETLSSSYQLGKRSDSVLKVKLDIFNLGFAAHWTNPTNYFGNDTKNVVKNLQKHYGLIVNGIVDEVTLAKIKDEASNLLRKGQRSDRVQKVKNDLYKLGFGSHWTNPTDYFGSDTESVVLEFQSFYGLAATGVVNEYTLTKIDEILNSPLKLGAHSQEVQKMKNNLYRLGFGIHWTHPTNYYGADTENVVRDFQRTYNLPVSGIVDKVTLAKIQDLLKSINYSPYNITLQDALAIQMKTSPQTDKNYAYVSKTYINNQNKVTADALNVRSGPGNSSRVIGTLRKGNNVTILEEVSGWYRIEFNSSAWVNSSKKDVLYYLDPTNFIDDAKQRFQFLNLSKSSGVTKSLLNNYLKGKGVLEGHGQTFITASRQHGVNDIYLLSHALLETGNGLSQLAKGVEVGVDTSGKPVLVTSSNRKNLSHIKTTYNMFGIGAVDNNALEGGAIRAYNEGWFTPEEAIIGGARFIGSNYIKAGQNTLYKMRWNPAAMAADKAAKHQYATDIGWASKQTARIYNLYSEIGITDAHLDIPQYR